MILHTDISGQGEPLVLLHGLFGSYENLGVIARSLQDYFQIINVDLRNHGRSLHHPIMNYQVMAQDVLETLDHFCVQRFNLLGHSMGGKVAMQLALSEPHRVKKLILADISPVETPPRHQTILEALSTLDLASCKDRKSADDFLAHSIPESGVRQFLLKSLVKDPQGALNWRFNLAALKANYAAILAAPAAEGHYHEPTLFIKGGLSDYIQPAHQTQILSLFPKATAKIIQGAGHWLHAEKPVAFSKIVADFLSHNG